MQRRDLLMRLIKDLIIKNGENFIFILSTKLTKVFDSFDLFIFFNINLYIKINVCIYDKFNSWHLKKIIQNYKYVYLFVLRQVNKY